MNCAIKILHGIPRDHKKRFSLSEELEDDIFA